MVFFERNLSVAGGIKVILLKLILISMMSIFVILVEAKEIDWSNHHYTHFSNEEPLKIFLESIASEQEIPIVVSDKVKGVVNVYFKEKKLGFIFNKIVSAYGLIFFYDGDVLYVYKAEEVQEAVATLSNSSIYTLDHNLRADGVLDGKVKWKIDEKSNSANFSGTKRFIDIILAAATKLDNDNVTTIYKMTDANGGTHFTNMPTSTANYGSLAQIKYKKERKEKKGALEPDMNLEREHTLVKYNEVH